MLNVNGYAACRVRVSANDRIYWHLPAREGSCVRLCFYYRGFLIFNEGCKEWAFSKARCEGDRRGTRYYYGVGERFKGTFADLFRTRREAIAEIDRRLSARIV